MKINLVLTPGYMLDDTLWSDVRPALETLAILHDADLSQDDAIESMARRLLLNAPRRFVLVGFSMGGYVAREAARLAPERVAGLILISTSARGDAAERRRQQGGEAALPGSRFLGLNRRDIRRALAPDVADERIVDRIQAMGRRLGPSVFARQSAVVRSGDETRLAGIDCPTLVIAGRQDQLRSVEEAEALALAIPDARLVIIEACGHMVPLERPAELLSAMETWLGEVFPDRL